MDQCQTQSPEDDVAIARKALAEGDLPHAIHHLAGALAADPTRAEWLALLDEVIRAAPEPLELVPIKGEKPPYFGTVAVHAYVLASLGRVPEAIELLLQVIHWHPGIAYLDWVQQWAARPEAAGKLPTGRINWFISALVKQFPALSNPQGGGRVTLDRMPAFLRLVRQTQPPDAAFLSISVSLLRRLGLLDEALEYGQAAYALAPGFQTAIAVAVAHESRRELEPALAAYRDALKYEPDDVSVRLSMADLLWDYGKTQEAQDTYADALRLDPRQPWALPSLLYLRWWREGSEEFRDQLLTLAEESPDNQRARQLADRAAPFFGFLPDPSDATTNIFNRLRKEGKPFKGMTRLTLSCLEAPSNFLALPHLFEGEVSVVAVQQPDPRQPRRPVEYLLWKYDGLKPAVAVPPPPPEVAQQVTGLLKQRYHLTAWTRAAGRLAQQLGPDRVGDLLAVMVHPPAPRESAAPWSWVYHVQVAAALVIAQLDSGWDGSVRQKALLSLIYGPMDWTVDAALVGLTAIARDEEQLAPAIADVFRDLLKNLPRGGVSCYYPALLWGSLLLPGLGKEERADLRRRWRDWVLPPPDEAEMLYKTAQVHEKNRDLPRAIEALTQALAKRPGYAEALWLRGLFYLDTQAPDKALGDFTELARLRPTVPVVHLTLGETLYHLRRYDEALAALSESIRLKADDWRAWYWRGLAQGRLKKHEEAVADFTQALTLKPDSASSYHQRGRSYGILGKYDEAIADQTKALELDPRLAAAYLERGLAYEDKGYLGRAIHDYTETLLLTPRAPLVYNMRAKLYYFRRDYANAIADHQSAYDLNPDDAQTCNYLAWLLATCPIDELRHGPQAVELATHANELTEWKRLVCLDTLAAAYAECGQFEEAVRYAQQAVDMAPEAQKTNHQKRLNLYRHGKPFRDAEEAS